MKTERELNQKYWNEIHDMVIAYNKKHGCEVKPWECVKYNGSFFSGNLEFIDRGDKYQFAVAILFDEQSQVHRPIFPEDKLYNKVCMGIEYIAKENGLQVIGSNSLLNVWGNGMYQNLTWNKPQPKRTFEINGVELPCPDEDGKYFFNIGGDFFRYKDPKDYAHVCEFLETLFTEARDK